MNWCRGKSLAFPNTGVSRLLGGHIMLSVYIIKSVFPCLLFYIRLSSRHKEDKKTWAKYFQKLQSSSCLLRGRNNWAVSAGGRPRLRLAEMPFLWQEVFCFWELFYCKYRDSSTMMMRYLPNDVWCRSDYCISLFFFFFVWGILVLTILCMEIFKKIIRTSLSRLIIIMQDNLLFSRWRRGDVSSVPCRSSFLSFCDSTVAAQQ